MLSCVGVMFAPHHQRAARRAGPGLSARRDDWADQLDTGRLHRPDVRDDEAVCPGTAVRRAAAAPMGRPGLRADSAGRRRHRLRHGTSHAESGPIRRRGGVPRLFQDLLRADDLGVPRYRRRRRNGSLRSTSNWRTWATAIWLDRRRWSGSTCWSPLAGADQRAGAKRAAPPGPGSGRASTRIPQVTESGSQSTILAATFSPLCSSSSTSAMT